MKNNLTLVFLIVMLLVSPRQSYGKILNKPIPESYKLTDKIYETFKSKSSYLVSPHLLAYSFGLLQSFSTCNPPYPLKSIFNIENTRHGQYSLELNARRGETSAQNTFNMSLIGQLYVTEESNTGIWNSMMEQMYMHELKKIDFAQLPASNVEEEINANFRDAFNSEDSTLIVLSDLNHLESQTKAMIINCLLLNATWKEPFTRVVKVEKSGELINMFSGIDNYAVGYHGNVRVIAKDLTDDLTFVLAHQIEHIRMEDVWKSQQNMERIKATLIMPQIKIMDIVNATPVLDDNPCLLNSFHFEEAHNLAMGGIIQHSSFLMMPGGVSTDPIVVRTTTIEEASNVALDNELPRFIVKAPFRYFLIHKNRTVLLSGNYL